MDAWGGGGGGGEWAVRCRFVHGPTCVVRGVILPSDLPAERVFVLRPSPQELGVPIGTVVQANGSQMTYATVRANQKRGSHAGGRFDWSGVWTYGSRSRNNGSLLSGLAPRRDRAPSAPGSSGITEPRLHTRDS
ncbi:hypothetical protein R1flu_020384 [Riccia fluitans]|uniref:Uncharacterized protein n=1 Tax=Riccia fluitans TaxID=41844 RepID=A0ABD1ZN12_9MARC